MFDDFSKKKHNISGDDTQASGGKTLTSGSGFQKTIAQEVTVVDSKDFTITFIQDGIVGGIVVHIDQNSDGTLSFCFTQVGFIGDFRGIFFDFDPDNDDIGPDIPSGLQFVNGSGEALGLKSLGSGLTFPFALDENNIKLEGAHGHGAVDDYYDTEIGIGTNGIGNSSGKGKSGDDIQIVKFTLSADSPLTLADFADVEYAFRLMSVGEVDEEGNPVGGREGSLKVIGEMPMVDNQCPMVGDVVADGVTEPMEGSGMGDTAPLIEGTGDHGLLGMYVFDPEGDPLTITSVNGVVDGADEDGMANGIFVIALDIGVLTVNATTGDYSFDLDEAAVNHLADGDTVMRMVSFTVTDGHTDPDTGEVCEETGFLKLTVIGANDAPHIEEPHVQVEITEVMDTMAPGDMEGTAPISRNLFADFGAWDPDDGDQVYVKINGIIISDGSQTFGGAGYGTLEVFANGDYTYTLDQDAVNHLAEGDMLMDSFTFSVVDRTSFPEEGKMSPEAELWIKINGANDSPTDGDEPCGDPYPNMIRENGSISLADNFNLLANASDPDDGDVVSFLGITGITLMELADPDNDLDINDISIAIAGNGLSATLTSDSGVSTIGVTAAGILTLATTSGDGAFDFLDSNDQVKISVDYQVSDILGKTDDSTAEICIQGQLDLELSNLVLYMNNEAEDDIIKVKFEDQDSFAVLSSYDGDDEHITYADILGYIADDPDGVLGEHTVLEAFSYHQGNNREADPALGDHVSGLMHDGEGQLVYVADGVATGFEGGEYIDGNKNQNDDVTTLADIAGTHLETNGAGNYEILGDNYDITYDNGSIV